MLFKEAFAQFQAEILPAVHTLYGERDIPAVSEAWNNFTDSLNRDGELTDLQIQYGPSVEDVDMNGDAESEAADILDAMGVNLALLPIDTRDDSTSADWSAGSRHFRFTVLRGSKEMVGQFSQGSAFTVNPTLCDILSCLLNDAGGVEDCDTFEEWADDYGYDGDSRKAERIYEACKKVAAELSDMFTKDELTDLRELLEFAM